MFVERIDKHPHLYNQAILTYPLEETDHELRNARHSCRIGCCLGRSRTVANDRNRCASPSSVHRISIVWKETHRLAEARVFTELRISTRWHMGHFSGYPEYCSRRDLM